MNLTLNNVDRFCGQVPLDQDRPVIDLSEITFFEPFGLVYLGMFLRYFNTRAKSFLVRPPKGARAREYLARQKFWERFNFDPNSLDEKLLRRFTSTTSLNDIVDIERRLGIEEEIAYRVRRVVANTSAKLDLELLEETVAELVDNFRRHSQGPLAALAMQWYPKAGELKMAIGDCGIGIRRSLRSNPRYAELRSRQHYEAIRTAIQPGVSRSKEAGFGLSTVIDNVHQAKGRLFLASGDGYVRKYGVGAVRYGTSAFDLSGVQISIAIPTR